MARKMLHPSTTSTGHGQTYKKTNFSNLARYCNMARDHAIYNLVFGISIFIRSRNILIIAYPRQLGLSEFWESDILILIKVR